MCVHDDNHKYRQSFWLTRDILRVLSFRSRIASTAASSSLSKSDSGSSPISGLRARPAIDLLWPPIPRASFRYPDRQNPQNSFHPNFGNHIKFPFFVVEVIQLMIIGSRDTRVLLLLLLSSPIYFPVPPCLSPSVLFVQQMICHSHHLAPFQSLPLDFFGCRCIIVLFLLAAAACFASYRLACLCSTSCGRLPAVAQTSS